MNNQPLRRCPICRNKRPLVSDHCHASGLKRELICGQCNTGLGMFADDPEAMRRAIRYLQRHKARADTLALSADVPWDKRMEHHQLTPWVMEEYARCHPRAKPR